MKQASNLSSPTPEKEIMDEDQAKALWQSLSKVPHTSGHLRKTLGGDFVKEYFNIITSREALEADWFVLTGQMDREEANQYILLSGEYEKIMNRLYQLAKKMADHFNPKLEGLIQKDLAGKGKEGIEWLFQMTDDLCRLSPKELHGKDCSFSVWTKTFKESFFSLIGERLYEIGWTSKDPKVQAFIKEFMKLLSKLSLKEQGYEFRGIQLYSEKNFSGQLLSNPKNIAAFDTVIGFKSLSDQERKQLEEENKTNFQEIKKEACYKKILLHKFRAANPQIMFLADELFEHQRHGRFCVFRINFNPRVDIGLPEKKVDELGNVFHHYDNNAGVISCTLNPGTGELCMMVHEGVVLTEILDRDRYVLLKSYLLKELKKYLENKESDVEDLFAPSAAETCKEIEQKVEDDVAATMEELIEEPAEAAEPDSIQPTWVHVAYEKPAAKPAAKVEEPNTLEPLSPGKKKEIMDRIWGATGAETLAALKRLLGRDIRADGGRKAQVRQDGSHVSLRSARTGQTLPIPKHESIAPPLVVHCVGVWGYSLVEYARELGVKGI